MKYKINILIITHYLRSGLSRPDWSLGGGFWAGPKDGRMVQSLKTRIY